MTHSVVLTDKPRMEHCVDQNGMIIHFRALQNHSQGFAINTDLFSLKQVLLNGRSTYSTRAALPLSNQLRSTRQACFFSVVSPQESSWRHRTIDWKGPDDEPRMVLCKHSNRPRLYLSLQNTTCSKRQIRWFIKVAVTLLFCTTICQQAHWTRLWLLQAKCSPKGNLAGGDSWRTH